MSEHPTARPTIALSDDTVSPPLTCSRIAVVSADGQQSQADHQHAGDGAAAERDVEGRLEAAASGFGGADVGPDRDDHPDEAGGSGKNRADQKSDRGFLPERGREEMTIASTMATMPMVRYCR